MNWQTTFISIAIIITVSSASDLQAKAGLPLINQVIGWVILGEWILLLLFLRDIDPFLPSRILPRSIPIPERVAYRTIKTCDVFPWVWSLFRDIIYP